MSRRMHIRPRPGVNPFALLMFLLLGTGGTPKPSRAQSRESESAMTERILRSQIQLGETVRVRLLNGQRQEGKLMGTTPSTLQVVGIRSQEPASISFRDVESIDRRGEGDALGGFLGGLGVGCGVGVACTIAYAALVDEPWAVLAGVFFLPAGILAGGVTGLVVGGHPRWERVYMASGIDWADPDQDEGSQPAGSSVDRVPSSEGLDNAQAIPSYEQKTSMLAMGLGAAVGLAGGILIATAEGQESHLIGYSMAGMTIGAMMGALLGTHTGTTQEWQKIFVVPQKDGVMVGYQTSF